MLKSLRLIVLVTLLITLLIPAGISYAGEQEIKVVLNGSTLNMDVKPVIIAGRTLVPLRAIFEALGAKVEWNGDTKTVTGTKDSKKVELTIDKKDALVNGERRALDVPAAIISSRTMVPLRFISESLGAKVDWDSNTLTANISLSGLEDAVQDTADKFKCVFAPTIDYGSMDKWNYTIHDKSPGIIVIKEVFKGQIFFVPVFAQNFKAGSNKKADIDYDIKVIAPDGQSYVSKEKLEFVKDKAVSENIIKANATLGIKFEEGDNLGKYKIQIEARDNISGAKYSGESEVECVEYKPDKSIDTEEKLSEFLDTYHVDPYPERLETAFITYLKGGEDNHAIDAFFAEAFLKNSFLLERIRTEISKQDKKVIDNSAVPMKFIEAYISVFKGKMTPEATADLGKPRNPVDMDILWGQFFASSSYTSMKEIVSSLEYSKFQSALEKEKTKQNGELSQDAQLGLLYSVGAWSIQSNIKRHPLIKSYCQYILLDNSISETVRTELKKILE